MKKSLLLVFLAASLDAQTLMLPPEVTGAAHAITAATLEAPVRVLADDLFEGRGPATRGDALTRLYLTRELQSIGLQPGVNGSWQQPLDVVSLRTGAPESWRFRGRSGETELALRKDFIVSSGVQRSLVTLRDAELVFVGYGISAPEYGWDDFKGIDLHGKIAVVMNNDPDWDPALFAGQRRLYYGRWSYKYEEAARRGAAGVMIIHTTPSAGYPWQVVQSSWSGEQFELPAEKEPRLQLKSWVTEEAARRIFRSAGRDLDTLTRAAHSRAFRPVRLGVTTTIELHNTITSKQTANVAGMLPGSDPALSSEIVVYTAHHDHFGIGTPDARGDSIYNGALDNATGCAQVLAIARAFAALPKPPKRSILFLFVAAEEQGLLGSLYFATHPTVPLGRIAANINIDGGNVLGRTRDLSQIGRGKSSLDAVLDAAAATQGRVVKDEEFPDRGFFYRSDQFNFARAGIPAIYLGAGLDVIGKPAGTARTAREEFEAKHYHQPSDEVGSDWDYSGMIEDAQLLFLTGLAIAEDPALPSWKKGDEFEAARMKALRDRH